MSGRHRALTRRPWWQVALAPRRRGPAARGPGRPPSTGAAPTVLVAAAGLAGVLLGSTLDAASGTVLMAASSLVPSVVLGSSLVRTRTDLASETRQRHRLAGEVAVGDDQLRRLADRVEAMADQASDDAAELERARTQLRRARVELATSRARLAGVREQVARARATATAATAARDEARSQVNTARAEAEAAAEAARRAEAALARATDDTQPWPAPVKLEGQRSFASVDLRVFDAFLEADMADEDAVLDAPARRGRHAAAPALDRPVSTPPAAAPQHPGTAADGAQRSVRDVA